MAQAQRRLRIRTTTTTGRRPALLASTIAPRPRARVRIAITVQCAQCSVYYCHHCYLLQASAFAATRATLRRLPIAPSGTIPAEGATWLKQGKQPDYAFGLRLLRNLGAMGAVTHRKDELSQSVEHRAAASAWPQSSTSSTTKMCVPAPTGPPLAIYPDITAVKKVSHHSSEGTSSSLSGAPMMRWYMARTSRMAVSKWEVGSNDSEMKTLSEVPPCTGTIMSYTS